MKKLFASMNCDNMSYVICIYKDHLFRLYDNGFITKVDEADIEAARAFGYIE